MASTSESQHVVVDIKKNDEEKRREQHRLPKQNEVKEIQHLAENYGESSIEEDVEQKNRKLLSVLEKQLKEVHKRADRERSVTIFRLPAHLHETNKQLCQPKMVSIGPYHRGKESLQTMEQHKLSLLSNFRARNRDVGLEVYLQELRALEEQARLSYSEAVSMNSDDFVTMLLLDGCFILEFFFMLKEGTFDPICGVGWAYRDIRSDLFLLENQIPFFVLTTLLRVQKGYPIHNCQEGCFLVELLYMFVINKFRPLKICCKDINHFLHLFYTVKVAGVEWPEEQLGEWPEDPICIIPSISELADAGVTFRENRSPRHLMDISFEMASMKIPSIKIDHDNNIMLWNMVAFEQSQRGKLKQTLSSYLALMDSLINTEMDVAILERCGVVENYLENNAGAADFFNQFHNYFVLDYTDHYFLGLFKKIKAYSELTRIKYRAELMRDYFNDPWTTIGFAQAVILLLLAILQTYASFFK